LADVWVMLRTFILLTYFVVGCVAKNDTASVALIEHTRKGGVTPNGVSPNGVSPNGVSPNGVSPNGVSPNGVSPNGVSPNGVSPNGVSPNGVSPNGVSPNGVSPNGVSPNGVSPNGVSTNGVSPNGVRANGLSSNGVNPDERKPNEVRAHGVKPNGVSPHVATPDAVTLAAVQPFGIGVRGERVGARSFGAPFAGADFVGSTWTGTLTNGDTVALRIDDAMPGTDGNADVWSYKVSVSADGTWRPLCLGKVGYGDFADTVGGSWNLARGVPGGGAYHADTPEFTIACRGSAISKCVEMGFKPWTGNSRELASCVRALRADYCGDGTPHTVDGTLVNIFDADGVQADSENWTPEAEWTPDGARCVSSAQNTRFFQAAHETPECFEHTLKAQKSCGTGFTGETDLITELRPR